MKSRYILFAACALLLASSSCRCQDDDLGGPWEISQGFDIQEQGFDADTGPDVTDADDVAPDADADADAEDIEDTEDTRQVFDAEPDTPPPNPWEPEDVPFEHALTDRTELVIDDDGTFWIAFHTCETRSCQNATLSVARRPVGGDWTIEDIEQHRGIFGIEVIEPGRPLVVFTQSRDNSFKAATRVGDRAWEVRRLPVSRGGRGDGFDLTQDGERFYVSFAADGASEVELFSKEANTLPGAFTRRTSLQAEDPQAAMGRGLRADTAGSAYLVHRNDDVDAYGVSRYDFGIDRWPQSSYLDTLGAQFVHSLFITEDFRLCMSGGLNDRLVATCGTMFDLERDKNQFLGESLAVGHPSSMIEGDDGTLYIAYNPTNNTSLKVARLAPGADFETGWEILTVFPRDSFGVSTAIDRFGNLAVSFYTCDNQDICKLKLLLEDPRSL
ncbi:MAG: hypothetical protein ACQEVA_14510 [Myxococcota bacterium]